MRRINLKLWLRLLLLLIIVYLTINILSELIFYYFVPVRTYRFCPIIGLFYLVTGIIVNFSLFYYRNTTQLKLLNIYMSGRIIKLALTVLFLVLYIYFLHPQKVAFVLTTIANYFIFSGLELYIYSLYNKRLAKHEKRQKKRP
ncbi:MAG: hypothetical protein PHG27_04235 [Massilibacteroides sp.]|nr:hypothetical protein [Massilibacteroides sp.]MDD3063659.1 hypothetical protein [Massilibacteroides sp.]MDD4114793.1 hypothetical protein [Massilibacteroides sp.]MDD4661198.1 hypothetical protein [Massilibacteroides sp.]